MLAFMSYHTVTFVIESMAAANAMVYWNRLQSLKTVRRRTLRLRSGAAWSGVGDGGVVLTQLQHNHPTLLVE